MCATDITVVIPTFERGSILVKTMRDLLSLRVQPAAYVIVDQTPGHPVEIARELEALARNGPVRILRLGEPSIPHAMNEGVRAAGTKLVCFLDDDIEPGEDLFEAHAVRHGGVYAAVAGQVLQPGQAVIPRSPDRRSDLDFAFNSAESREICNVMAGNLSVSRSVFFEVGGFDQQFKGSAYRFETDFALRLTSLGYKILFAPGATIRHLRLSSGGTRKEGDHLGAPAPGHGVGDYYFALRHKPAADAFRYSLRRCFRAVCARHYVYRPDLIPRRVLAEVEAWRWARRLHREGPRLISGARSRE